MGNAKHTVILIFHGAGPRWQPLLWYSGAHYPLPTGKHGSYCLDSRLRALGPCALEWIPFFWELHAYHRKLPQIDDFGTLHFYLLQDLKAYNKTMRILLPLPVNDSIINYISNKLLYKKSVKLKYNVVLMEKFNTTVSRFVIFTWILWFLQIKWYTNKKRTVKRDLSINLTFLKDFKLNKT